MNLHQPVGNGGPVSQHRSPMVRQLSDKTVRRRSERREARSLGTRGNRRGKMQIPRLRTAALTAALMTAAVPALPSSANAWGWGHSGWGWGGFGVGLAAGALIGGALAAPYYGGYYGYGYPAYGSGGVGLPWRRLAFRP